VLPLQHLRRRPKVRTITLIKRQSMVAKHTMPSTTTPLTPSTRVERPVSVQASLTDRIHEQTNLTPGLERKRERAPAEPRPFPLVAASRDEQFQLLPVQPRLAPRARCVQRCCASRPGGVMQPSVALRAHSLLVRLGDAGCKGNLKICAGTHIPCASVN
jgi:hypothetical protein